MEKTIVLSKVGLGESFMLDGVARRIRRKCLVLTKDVDSTGICLWLRLGHIAAKQSRLHCYSDYRSFAGLLALRPTPLPKNRIKAYRKLHFVICAY